MKKITDFKPGETIAFKRLDEAEPPGEINDLAKMRQEETVSKS